MANQYELVYVLSPVLGEEGIPAVQERVKALIETSGTIENIDDWGRRKLAYEIQDQKEGHYVVVRFSAPSEAPREIERVLKITEGVLRYLIVRVDG